jgi:ABC-2 type transport system ATP-binding protein
MKSMLELKGVEKEFKGGQFALRNISLTIEPGILGLLGRNGAGKSSLINVLATISRPTAGTIMWSNSNIVKKPTAYRRVLGFLPQDFGVYDHLSIIEFLLYCSSLKELDYRAVRSQIKLLLTELNLTTVENKALGKLSGGMRQRVGIAQSLLGDPEVLILDEPSVGLDPIERLHFLSMIQRRPKTAITILSTHIVSDIENIADRVVILEQGLILRDGSAASIIETSPSASGSNSLERAYVQIIGDMPGQTRP